MEQIFGVARTVLNTMSPGCLATFDLHHAVLTPRRYRTESALIEV
jgi:hypothetical protein